MQTYIIIVQIREVYEEEVEMNWIMHLIKIPCHFTMMSIRW